MTIKEIKLPNIKIKVKEDIFISDDVYGRYCDNKCVIEIRDNLNKDIKKATFLHETIHAIDSLNTGIVDLNEAQVELLAHSLLYLIRENKEFIKYIQTE